MSIKKTKNDGARIFVRRPPFVHSGTVRTSRSYTVHSGYCCSCVITICCIRPIHVVTGDSSLGFNGRDSHSIFTPIRENHSFYRITRSSTFPPEFALSLILGSVYNQCRSVDFLFPPPGSPRRGLSDQLYHAIPNTIVAFPPLHLALLYPRCLFEQMTLLFDS